MADPLDELYLGDFAGFVGRRNALAKRLLAEGDEHGADRVRALSKPSRAAWAVNQFGDREPKLRDELLHAGAALREAQDRLVAGDADAAAFKRARDAERAAVSGAMGAIAAIVDGDGAKLSATAAERVRQTLHAVALDEDVRREFEEHRLESDREATGLIGVPAAGGSRPRARKPKQADDADRRRREELKAAEAELRRLEGDQLLAEEARDAAGKDAERAQRELDKATKQVEKRGAETATARARAETLRAHSDA